jgi:hypothetical protein
MNSASEANAAASWIRVLNMGVLSLRASNSNASARVPGRALIVHIRELGLIICSPYPVDIVRAGGSKRPRIVY